MYRSLITDDAILDQKENIGRRYNVSGDLKRDFEKLKQAIDLVKEKGGLFANHLLQTDTMIVLDENNKDEIIKTLKHPYEGKFITFEEFIDNKQ